MADSQEFISKLAIIGNNDAKVSPYLKCWIAQPDLVGNITSCVVGVIGPGTARSLQANWNSPFEQSNLGGMFEKVGGFIQATTDRTSTTTFSSTQVWEGNRPNNFSLTLLFYAVSDAYKEVMLPLKALEIMMGPNVPAASASEQSLKGAISKAANSGNWAGSFPDIMAAAGNAMKSLIPGGRIPLPVVINIGRNMVVPNCVIESMMVPLDGPRTKDGWLTKAEATLNISTKVMLNQTEIAKTWP